MKAQQESFIDGLDQISEESSISEKGYKLLINGRQRFDSPEPIRKHVEITDMPTGKKQGIVAVGDFKILFVAGEAFYQQENVGGWIQIPGLLMDTVVDKFYVEVVPASTFNFVRRLSTTGNINDPIIANFSFAVSGTPAALVVQDGVNQPWLIFYDSDNGTFIARESKTYDDWSDTSEVSDDREYVPIGTQMMSLNGILFVVSRDKKRLLRSVSNRPLDFMVNINASGQKQGSETSGGADSVSFSADFDDITCIKPINIPDSFIYATARNTRIITLDYLNTIFGEPTFRVSAIVEAGVVNEDGIADILGDYALCDEEGILSFNAVKQLKYEGRNSVFSLMLSGLLRISGVVIKQRAPRAIEFDNYVLFNLETNIGNGIIVYDTLLQKWVAVDITGVIDILQFAIVKTTSASYLYALTARGKLFKMFSNETDREMAMLFTRSFVEDECKSEHKSEYLHISFDTGTEAGTVRVIEYVDNQSALTFDRDKVLLNNISSVLYPVKPPVIPNTEVTIQTVSFPFKDGRRGKKIYYIICWDNDAKIHEFEVITTKHTADSSRQQQARLLEIA